MKVLIPEKFATQGIKVLEEAGVEVTYKPDCTAEELVSLVEEYDGLIVRSATTVTREVIEAGKNLKIIGRAGVGVDNIDSTAATEHGIIVCNAPTSNVVSAAEQTMALMLAVMRNTARADASMKQGKWDRSKFVGHEMQGKTLAVFGLGHVGCLVIERAQAFGMNIIGYDPYCPPQRAESMGVELLDDINEMCKRADVITVHLPKTKETTGMFGPEQYALMKDGVVCINTARGGIYDIEAMADFIESGKIAGAGVDVWENEPVSDSPLHKFENVVLTPHLGASTKEAQTRAATQIAEYVIAGMQGKTVATVVNSARIPDEVMNQLSPYVPVCQKTGEMLAQLATSAISKLDVNVFGQIAHQDPTILGTASAAGILSVGSEVNINIINANYWAENRGIELATKTDPSSEDFASYIELIAHTKNGDLQLAATKTPAHDNPRIISIMNHGVDFVPEEHVVIMQYQDGPGRMGKIGTLLGNAGISIENMQIARDTKADAAIVCMNVDRTPSKDLQEKLTQSVDALNAWFIEL